jgi:hypothetical protein
MVYRLVGYYYSPSPLSSERLLRLLALKIWVMVSLNPSFLFDSSRLWYFHRFPPSCENRLFQVSIKGGNRTLVVQKFYNRLVGRIIKMGPKNAELED